MSLINFASKIFPHRTIGTKALNSAKTVTTKKYALLEKTEKLPIANYPDNKWVFPENADTFTIVKVGKTNDPNYFKEITSFYDQKGRIVKRCTKGSDINNQVKDYEHDFYGLANKSNLNILGADTRKITTQEYVIPEELREFKKAHPEMSQYIIGKWKTKSQEFQAVSTLYEGSYTRYPKKLTIIKNTFNQDNPEKLAAEMVEYPFTRGYEPQSAKKVLGLELEVKNGIPHIIGTNQTTNIKIPTNDEFLPFRLYVDRTAQKVALTRHFLKKKGLEKLDLNIEPNSSSVGKNTYGCFSATNEKIAYREPSKFFSEADVVAHEVEHAYQHSLIGRVGKGNTSYEEKCAKLLPEIKSETLKKEALDYVEANEKYPNLKELNDLSYEEMLKSPIYKEYRNNLLEVNARKAGELAEAEYKEGKKFLTDQFIYALDGNIL